MLIGVVFSLNTVDLLQALLLLKYVERSSKVLWNLCQSIFVNMAPQTYKGEGHGSQIRLPYRSSLKNYLIIFRISWA